MRSNIILAVRIVWLVFVVVACGDEPAEPIAQQIHVEGVVESAADASPIHSARVWVYYFVAADLPEETLADTLTDMEGRYSLTFDAGSLCNEHPLGPSAVTFILSSARDGYRSNATSFTCLEQLPRIDLLLQPE